MDGMLCRVGNSKEMLSDSSAKSVHSSTEIPGFNCRSIRPSDINQVKELCAECFPIDYPHNWFVHITSSSSLFSVVALIGSKIIGMIIVETKPFASCSPEDCTILSWFSPSTTQVTYILSFGVFEEFRKTGVGSLLLDQTLDHLKNQRYLRQNCKAVYLHVLASNFNAQKFYERRGFKRHCFLSEYYTLRTESGDGYSYVKYINGGEAPWSLRDYASVCWRSCSLTSLQRLPLWLYGQVKLLSRRLWPVQLSSAEERVL
eukprot:m.31807 g.31807  ORF g.31807 m.31807 type:complete len:259 (+) comp31551_c0_seq2:259-1035(+)